MKITEKRNYRGNIEYTICEIEKAEFYQMSKEDKIACLRDKYKNYEHTYIVGLKGYEAIDRVSEDVLILNNSNYEKFLFDLNTCKKTRLTRIEYEKITGKMAKKVEALKNKREAMLKEIEAIEAEIINLENELNRG